MAEKPKLATILGLTIVMVVVGAISTHFLLPIVYATDAEPSADVKPQRMPVDVVVIEKQPIRIWKNFSGRLTAVDFVEIRPQTTGLITDVKFEDGQFVNKGDILYVIDPRPFKAALEKAKADLFTARNRSVLADKEYERTKNLIETKIISQQIYDETVSGKLIADSTVKIAEAQLSQAEINLSYAYVKAPISGRVSRTEITKGNLVSAGSNPPLLTTIVSSKNIYADFEVDEMTYLQYMRSDSSKKSVTFNTPVELRLQSDTLTYQGKIHAFDNRIDPASGTIRARAIFDNPKGQLLPGMFARVRLGSANEENRILLSERAIGTDQNRKFVYVVNSENKTTYREVQLGHSIDGNRIILSGLEVGDKVIIRGLMRIRPHMDVEPNVTNKAIEAFAKS